MEPLLSHSLISPLIDMLTRIRRGEFKAEDRQDAILLFKKTNTVEFKKVQEHLSQNGYSTTIAQQLCKVFAHLADQTTMEHRHLNLPHNHILRRLRAEHDLYRCYLTDLTEAVATLGTVHNPSTTSSEFRHLTHLIGNLSGLKEHFECEEDAIYPYLKKVGWSSLCETAERQHHAIQENLNQMISLTLLTEQITMDGYITTMMSLTRQLTPRLLSHLA